MEARIGRTLDGQVARFDTSSTASLLLVGDGKTTIARYLARWWLANTTRHAHAYSHVPSEWADLRCERALVEALPSRQGCSIDGCMVVIDDIDQCTDEQVAALPLGIAPVIMTSHGGNNLMDLVDLMDKALPAGNLTCLGLVRAGSKDPFDAAVLDGQGRLDWPLDIVPVVPDQRAPLDLPCHRWQVPAAAWAPERAPEQAEIGALAR